MPAQITQLGKAKTKTLIEVKRAATEEVEYFQVGEQGTTKQIDEATYLAEKEKQA